MMTAARPLADADARRRALLAHDETLLVEAGAGSGKTSLMAGRVALLLAAGVPAREIVAITFTEAAASELRERIDRYVTALAVGEIPGELRQALPKGLTRDQSANLTDAARTLDELTCSTIHGFCQQLVRPYPVEAGIDPGAAILDPAASSLIFEDLVRGWLSARFGRSPGADGLGRFPGVAQSEDEDFFAELLCEEPEKVIGLIQSTAAYLRTKRTAKTKRWSLSTEPQVLSEDIAAFQKWFAGCGVVEEATKGILADLGELKDLIDEDRSNRISGKRLAQLFWHPNPRCRNGTELRFSAWRHKGKWEAAAKEAGLGKAKGSELSAQAQVHYDSLSRNYRIFVEAVTGAACSRFFDEFESLKTLYADYKRQAALLDFDDLLHHARDLLASNEEVLRSLSRRYPRILVDEFQDTDPLQAEILWLLCGEGRADQPWISRALRPGGLFVVGDPKQAIYRFRGADVDTYMSAKAALLAANQNSVLEITANFRSLPAILQFVNDRFEARLDETQRQPGFTALNATREPSDHRPSVACFEVVIDDRHADQKGKPVVNKVRRQEAATVARLVASLIDRYQVWDRRSQQMRPCQAGDIALLAPTGTNLWIYESAIEQSGVPIASQAGKSFYRRQEVQDLIAIARAIADRRDTLGLGALLRGPLVGLTEEEIADAIIALSPMASGAPGSLTLRTDLAQITDPILRNVLAVLQDLARKANRNTPYLLMAEAIEALNVRPILRARYRHGAERALANVELFLEMARAYDVRGLTSFVEILRASWEDSEKLMEGRPDADADAVTIITMHSAKGLEWPIVIPINSCTELEDRLSFVHHRPDDTVHFRMLGEATGEYEAVAADEVAQIRRERVRLWYVALTRACDLLLLPRQKQNERSDGDWMSLIGGTFEDLPLFEDASALAASTQQGVPSKNLQSANVWSGESDVLAAMRRSVIWRSPSRHEGPSENTSDNATISVIVDAEQAAPIHSSDIENGRTRQSVKGGPIRGMIIHKLIEEILTGETAEEIEPLVNRAAMMLRELGQTDGLTPDEGPNASEMANYVLRALAIEEIANMRKTFHAELPVFSIGDTKSSLVYVGGIVDALAINEGKNLKVVIDWKSDVEPAPSIIDDYNAQMRDYLMATDAQAGFLVFSNPSRIIKVS